MSSEEEEDSDDALLEGYESILDICRSLLPERMLQWHYRSRDERLISLSNEHIYHNSLTTFPGNIGQSPIHFVKVDHVARHSGEAKSNPTEVGKVVDLMFCWFLGGLEGP